MLLSKIKEILPWKPFQLFHHTLADNGITDILDLSDPMIYRARIKFKNGYQLSIIVIKAYIELGLVDVGNSYELAIIDDNGQMLSVEGDDVIPHQSADEVKDWIKKVGSFNSCSKGELSVWRNIKI